MARNISTGKPSMGKTGAPRLARRKNAKKPRQGGSPNQSRRLPRIEVGTDAVSELIHSYQVPDVFDQEALAQAEALPDTVRAKDRKGRRDLRALFMVTIDGADAKDLDDAVSLERLEDGRYELGVHIADVTHYVKESTALDREAFKRGTSVYLADRVLPMLPARLSNGICSLNEKAERLALSCLMEIDEKGNVVHYEIVKSVICVDHRMTYEAVDRLLTEEKAAKEGAQYADCVVFFRDLSMLRDILLRKRMKRGAIDFDLAEAKILLDEQGKIVDIRREERTTATSMIEEAMLVCNETIAYECNTRRLPFVFRSHEAPDPAKLQQLSDFVRELGFSFHRPGSSRSIQKLLSGLKGSPQAPVIERAVLQSMQQARYTPENLGHYGLAAGYYCHFTAPIRRYPDLQIHRIIKESLEGPLQAGRNAYLRRSMPGVCRQCSLTERRAVELERAVESIKKAEYMADQVGAEFEAVISGVKPWGVYVELPNTVEGLVPARALSGLQGNPALRLGNRLTVQLVKADTKSGHLDFQIVYIPIRGNSEPN